MDRKHSGLVVDYHYSLDDYCEHLETFRTVRIGLHVHADCHRALRLRKNALRPRLSARIVHRPIHQKNLHRSKKTGVHAHKGFSMGFMGSYDGNFRAPDGMDDTEGRICTG